MDKYAELGQLLKNIANPNKYYLFTGIVKEIEEDTCSVDVGGLVVSGVRLKAIVSDENDDGKDSLLITPKKESHVLIGSLSGDLNDLAVLLVDKVETICIHGGENGGLVKTIELRKQLNILSERVNVIIKAIKESVPAPNDGGFALKDSMENILNSLPKAESFSNIENEKVRH